MADEAHDWTDAKIAELEKRLKAEYDQAAKEMLAKHDHYLKVYDKAKKKIDDLESAGTVTPKEAKDMRMRYMLQEQRMKKMADDYAADAVDVGRKATQIINDELPMVMAENYNWATFDIESQAGVDTAFTLADEDTVRRLIRDSPNLLPDVTFDGMAAAKINGQRFTSAITQGVLQGESIPNIAKRIRSVTDMGYRASIRAARTACTSAESAGREEGYKRAEDLGIKLGRRWIATHDNRTRMSHRLVDGEVRKTGEKYSNGLLFPGDPAGPPEETLNCRCRTAGAVDGFEPLEETYKRLYGKKAGHGFLTFDQDPDAAFDVLRKYIQSRLSPTKVARTYPQWVEEHSSKQTYVAQDIGIMPKRPKMADYPDDESLQAARIKYRAEREEFNQKKEELVTDLLRQPSHGYDSVEAIEAWAKKRSVEIMDDVFSEIDSRALDEIIDVHETLFEKYPQVKKSFDNLGSHYRISLSDDTSCFMEAIGGIELNKSYFDAYRSAIEATIEGYTNTTYDKSVGRTLRNVGRGDGTFRTAVTHEFGHNLDSAIRDGLEYSDTKTFEQELMNITRAHTTSEYSLLNETEAFAEGFAEMETNPSSEYGKAFADFLRRWL